MSNCELKITFSSDEYKAYADFIPAIGVGAELSIQYTKSVISEVEIVEGIDLATISSTIEYCNSSKKSKSGVLIATGKASISEVLPYWNLQEKFFKHAMEFDAGDLKVDFKEVSNFTLVKKGELIATKKEGREGVEGLSVKGKKLPFKRKKIVQFTAGKNTTEHEGKLYASTSGRYEVSDSRVISINDVLHVAGNVDYGTGNISFGKDVIIEGEVKDGFKVAVGGSLLCKSNLDATDVLCRKNLTADKGIIGRGEAIVRVGGKIEARFVENCHLESKQGIGIEKDIMNCQVYSLGSLHLGEKGAIVSSHVYCELGIRTYNIGKKGSQNSELEVGFSFVDKRLIDSIRQRVDVLKEKLEKLNRLPEYRKTDKKLELIKQIEQVTTRGQVELDSKTKLLYKHKNATVEVVGTVYPGNVIVICGVKYNVTEEMKGVKFYLNPETLHVESVSL